MRETKIYIMNDTISEAKFWEMFNEYIRIGFDEKNAEALVLMDYDVKWDERID
jgi:hypothetical protein